MEGDFDIRAVISAQTSQFERGLKDCQSSVSNLTNSLGKISDIIKKAFTFTGITLGIKSITDFGKACVQSATEAEKTFSILDNTVKTTGADAWISINELTQVSKTLSDSTNYSVTEIQRMQSVLLGFTNITGEAFEGASEAVLDMATVMGMDLTSAVQTVGKALDDPINGLDSLRRQGFKFTEEQKEQLKQLVENGNRMEAQKIILDELAISYGGASQAGQTAFAKITHSIENFQDTLGSELIPFVKEFFDDIAGMINNMMEEVKKIDFTPIHDVLIAIEPLVQSIFGVMLDLLKSILPPLGMIANLLQPVFSILGSAISSVSSAISWFMGTEYDAEKSTSEMNKVLSLQTDRVNELTNEIRKLTVEQRNAQQASLKSAMLAQQSSIEKTTKLMKDLEKEITDLEDEYNELNQGVSAYFEIEEELGGGGYWDSIQAGIIRTSNNIEEGNEALEETVNNAEKLANMEDNLKEKREKYNKLNEELKVLSAEYESLQAQLKKFGDFEFEEAQRVERERIEAENKAKRAKEEALNDLSKYIDSMNDKELAQKIKLAQQEMDIDIRKAENAGKSEEEIAEIRRKANDEIKGYMLQQIQNEEEAEKKKLEALEAVVEKTEETEELRTKIHDYYTHERESVELKFQEIIGNAIEEQKRVNYTWDIKLLQLDKEKTTRDKERQEIEKQILEYQRQEALASADISDHKKINEYYDRLIKDLTIEQEKALEEVLDTEKQIIETKQADYSWTQKLKQQEISRLQSDMDMAVERAKAEGKSEEEIAKIKEEYFTEMQNKQLELLALQKEIDLARSTSSEQAFEIDTYYANEEIALAEETARKIAQAYAQIPSPLAPEKGDTGSKATEGAVADIAGDKTSDDKSTELYDYFQTLSDMNAEYNEKLKAQKLARIEAERDYDLQYMKDNGATQEEIYAVNKAYTQRILKMKLEALEEEKNALLNSLPDDENYAQLRANIETYYLNEETEMRKDAYKEIEKERAKDVKDTESTWSKITKGMKKFTETTSKIFSGISSVISRTFNGIKNIFSTGFSALQKIATLNLDDILDSVLKFEDGVLTFFVETIHKLPEFVSSLMQAVGSMFSFIANLDWGIIGKTIESSLMTFLNNLPSIINDIFTIFNNMLTMLSNMDWTSIFTAIGEAIQTFFDNLPQTLTNLISTLSKVIKGIIESDLIETVFGGFADAICEFLGNADQIKEFITSLIVLIGKLAEVLVKDAGKIFGALIEALPDILMAILVSLPELLADIIGGAFDGVLSILKGTVNFFIKGINGLIDALNWADFFDWFDDIPHIPLLAKGTLNAQKGLAIVGEAGPELVNFRGGEQVYSNRKTNEMLSGSNTNNFNVTFNNLQDTSAYEMMRQLKQYQREMAINSVL